MIVTFDPVYVVDFARLNYEWIARYFQIEPHDRDILDHPEKYVIEPGGEVFFALSGDTIAGTVAIIPAGEATFELTKMAVSQNFRGQGFANLLMDACVEFGRNRGAKTIFLETNSILAPAIALYKKYGFAETELDPNSEYTRANVRMELALRRGNL